MSVFSTVKSDVDTLTALLRTRQLDRTLASAAGGSRIDKAAVGLPEVDGPLQGGLPRGQLSELVGPRSSGRTSIVHAMLAAATARGELTALVDTLDTFDPLSAAQARVGLQNLLWVRGPSLAHSAQPSPAGPQGELLQRAVERAVKAFNLILQAGRFGIVVLDLADVPVPAIRRLPFTTWLRLQRAIEGSEQAGLLIAEAHINRSARGVTIQLAGQAPLTEAVCAPRSPWELPAFHLQLAAISSQAQLKLRAER